MKKLALAALVALSLSACGNTAQERMLSGGLMGAGAGALLGAATTPDQQPHRGGYGRGGYDRGSYGRGPGQYRGERYRGY